MSERKRSNSGLICCVCGHPIEEEHEFYVHERGTKDKYLTIHSDCIAKYKSTRKRNVKKTQ